MAVKINTYEAYRSQVYVHIVPYFRSKNTMLSQLTPGMLEEYYLVKYNAGLSGLTIRKHHSNIKMALSYAVKNGLTDHNAALLAELPCTDRYCGNFISTDQFEIILNKVKNTDLYTPVFLAGTMGLRRSEVLGLRWSDINFETQTMCIQHTVVKCIKDHKITLVFSDVPKTRASRRTLPLPSGVLRYLKELRRRQCDNYTAHRDKYSREYLKYICVDDMGLIVKPDDLSVGSAG
jgi:integrase